jgi:chromosome segregation ATPase
LVKDYRKSDQRLRKANLKAKQSEHTIYEYECEISKLKQKHEMELATIMQFEQDYSNQREEFQNMVEEINHLNLENKKLRETIKDYNKEKQDLQGEISK